MIKIILLILLAEIWGTAGQIFYKISVNKVEPPDLRSLNSYLKFLKKVLLAPTLWVGLAAIMAGLVIWLIALAQADLSLAFPIDSMQYIITLIGAHIFLGERINKLKLAGTLLIVAGIIFVAIS